MRSMDTLIYDENFWKKKCPKVDCKGKGCDCGLHFVSIAAALGDDSPSSPVAPKNGNYCNALVKYEANGNLYLYSKDGVVVPVTSTLPQSLLDRIAALEAGAVEETEAREEADAALGERIDGVETDLETEVANRTSADNTLQANINSEAQARASADTALGTRIDGVASDLAAEATARQNADATLQGNINAEATTRANADTALNTAITNEATARQNADNNLQAQIDGISASSDVKDIVGTKAELNNYDTSTLGDNDIIKVLQDESEGGATTYYRWSAATNSFTLIGEEGPYYTKSQADTLLNAKQNTLTAGTNVQIVGSTISATDTTYTAGTGLNLSGTQFSVDTTTIATQTDLTNGLATKQNTLTAGTGISIVNGVISCTFADGNGIRY